MAPLLLFHSSLQVGDDPFERPCVALALRPAFDGEGNVFITAAMHAREYATAELVTRFAEYLVENYGSDADVTWVLDHHEIHLMLQTNPDGRKIAEDHTFWRKNTNSELCDDSDLWGVDLNRNFSFEWDCCGGSIGKPHAITCWPSARYNRNMR